MITAYLFIVGAAAAAYKAAALTAGGALTAAVIGSVIWFGLGWQGFSLLLLFFITSSLFSLLPDNKEAEEINAENGARRAGQVFANGGAAAVSALLYWITGSELWIAAFAGSLAAAASDTWASEWGTRSNSRTYLFPGGQKVPAGTSGAVTVPGTAAALLGAVFIGGAAAFLFSSFFSSIYIMATAVAAAGFLGNLMDTGTGAFFQVTYRCRRCGLITEKQMHCGNYTLKTSGWKWADNEAVNTICTVTGGGLCLLLLWLIR